MDAFSILIQVQDICHITKLTLSQWYKQNNVYPGLASLQNIFSLYGVVILDRTPKHYSIFEFHV